MTTQPVIIKCKCQTGRVVLPAGKLTVSTFQAFEFFFTTQSHGGRCWTCGSRFKFVTVQGKVSDHVCNDRCEASKGPVCECSCGGKNHGAAYGGA